MTASEAGNTAAGAATSGGRAEITAGAIARLAGVRPAAVSNWRRRHEDFPQPVGGSGASPAFSLADVERWLSAHGKLAEVPVGERAWQTLLSDPSGPAEALAAIGGRLVEHGVALPEPDSLGEAVAALVRETSPADAYAFLLGRLADNGANQSVHTPPETAALMASLAGPADSVLDPACGLGSLLAAAQGPRPGTPPAEIHGQDRDDSLTRLAGPRLALRGAAVARLRAGDSLLEDAFAELTADTVLCHPPTNDRHWGHDELAFDPRWEYGLPPRTESELAWVQHAMAHLAPGGTAVLMVPPGVAARRTGRRIRAALLRRGALRAVIALPAGAAPPHSLTLHLWVLTRPTGEPETNPRLLLMDTSTAHMPGERESLDWQALRRAVDDAWSEFRRRGDIEPVPGLCAAPPVIELLDDETDLTPARHLLPLAQAGEPTDLARTVRDLRASLGRSTKLLPDPLRGSAPAADGPPTAELVTWSDLTLGELVRTGATEIHTVTSVGQMPSARVGDLFLPLLPGETGLVPRVVTEAGQAPPGDRYVALVRPDPAALDTWFLAGFLRGSGNVRQAGSYASSAARIDPRRLKVPRLALPEQQRYGRRFRELAEFEAALAEVAGLARQMVQGTVDGLTEGTLAP